MKDLLAYRRSAIAVELLGQMFEQFKCDQRSPITNENPSCTIADQP
jgi:hypothetical protein